MSVVNPRLTYIGFDPGKTTGVSIVSLLPGEVPQTNYMWQVKIEDMPALFDELDTLIPGEISGIIYERFITYRQYAQRQVGSKQEAAQVIGMVKMWAAKKKAPTVEQGADILNIAYRWTGFPRQKDHSKSHAWDAYHHVIYYLIKNKLAKPFNMKAVGS